MLLYKDVSTIKDLDVDKKSLIIEIINNNNLDRRESCTESNIHNFSLKYLNRIIKSKKFIKNMPNVFDEEEIEFINSLNK